MQPEKIFFSIVIPLYNKGCYVSETIRSVLKQTHRNFEIIVVNDSSTDDSIEIISAINDDRLTLYTKSNGGVSAARNYGINKAKYEYICFLDADDIWDNTYLENLSMILCRFPDVGLICGAYKMFRNHVEDIVKVVDFNEKQMNFVSRIDFFKESVKRKRIVPLTSSVCVRKTALNLIGTWFAEGVCNGEDADLWVRLAMKTEIVYYNQPLMFYRLASENSLFFNNLSINKSFPYWKWYSFKCDNKYKNKLTTRMIYTMAVFCWRRDNISDGICCLNKCRGIYLLPHRLFLLLRLQVKNLCRLFK